LHLQKVEKVGLTFSFTFSFIANYLGLHKKTQHGTKPTNDDLGKEREKKEKEKVTL
jgi:hypothetical protein